MKSFDDYRQKLPRGFVRHQVPPARSDLGDISLDELRSRLVARLHRCEAVGPVRVRAAVLAVFGDVSGEPGILLTRRATSLRVHSGEVSFPGGGRERGESAVETALREAHEEVGLVRERVEVLGIGPLGFTRSSGGRFVTVVGIMSELSGFVAQADEVDAVLTVPLSRLVRPEFSSTELWYRAEFGWRDMHFYDLGEDLCWGATAKALTQLLDMLGEDY